MDALTGTFPSMNMEDLAKMVVGYDKKVPLLNGKLVQYINLDNAASTPALSPVMEKVNEAMEWYSSIHRGTGFNAAAGPAGR